MRKCQRCETAPASANNARYCRPCADAVRREGKKRAAYKHGHSNTRLYSVTDSVWPAGFGLTSVEWRHLAKDDPDLAGAILADRKGRLFQLTPAGPVAVAE